MDVSAAFGDVSVAVAFVGLMAFFVSVITEGLKRIKWIEERIPTAITVIVLSLVLCPTSLIALFAWMKQPIEWEEVFASFLAAFVVALVAMDGWEKIRELADRTIPKGKE